MTDADKRMHPQHFGTDLMDVRIRIRINLIILNRIPDHCVSIFGIGGGLCSLSAFVVTVVINTCHFISVLYKFSCLNINFCLLYILDYKLTLSLQKAEVHVSICHVLVSRDVMATTVNL